MIKIKSKFVKVFSLLMLVLALAACSSQSNGEADEQPTPAPTSKPAEVTLAPDDGVAEPDDEDSKLPEKKYVVVLDPGHGGGYSGAVYGELVEKELTLRIGFYVKEYLEENYSDYIEVYMTREKDSALSGDIAEDLELRAQFAKDKNADIYVSLHLNASEEHNMSGAMAFISNRTHVNEQSKLLADSILEELAKLGLENEGSRTRNSNDMFDEDGNALDYYAVNRHCAARDIPGIIVEHCFMDNEVDVKYIDTDAMLKNVAIADAEGIASYLLGEQ